jgi:transcriptional regulator with XRE-family HTH domain
MSRIERRIAEASRLSTRFRRLIADEFRAARMEAGVSLADVARAVDASEAEISRIERGLADRPSGSPEQAP